MGNRPLNILELTCDEFTEELKIRYGKGTYHATVIYREIFRNGNMRFRDIPELSKSKKFMDLLENDLRVNIYPVASQINEAGLIKFITRLKHGHEIESVIVPMATRSTLCISSQIGCKMGCFFCETAQMGFHRNLSIEEIIGQVFTAKFHFGVDIRNVVFMGMGEPLDNFRNVIQAIRIISDQKGFNIAKRYITLSTIGKIDGIRQLAEQKWPTLKLAISLNAPNDGVRSQIMPMNRMWPMKRLKRALMDYPLKKSGVFMMEYVLIKHVNDSRDQVRELARFLEPLRVRINVIPYNPRSDSPFKSPSSDEVERFCGWLVDEKMFVRKRSVKGQHIMAACGQLGR